MKFVLQMYYMNHRDILMQKTRIKFITGRLSVCDSQATHLGIKRQVLLLIRVSLVVSM